MFYLKKNIWLAFYFITTLWVIFIIISIYFTVDKTFEEVKAKQQSVTVMAVNSLQSAFNKYDIILDFISEIIISDMDDLERNDIKLSLIPMTKIDKSIVSINVIKMNGDLYLDTSLKNDSKLPYQSNIEGFISDFIVGNMTLHRTVYDDFSKKYILPISKVVRVDDGGRLYVLVLQIDIDKGFRSFLMNNIEDELDDTYLYRENDHYFQIAPTNRLKDIDIYNYQVDDEEVDKAISRVELQSKHSYEYMKSSGEVVYHKILFQGRHSIAASLFIPEYKLWVVSEIEIDKVYNIMYVKIIMIVVFFLFLLTISYYLFKTIYSSQRNRGKMLQYQAEHDHLTGLKNHYHLNCYLENTSNKEAYSIFHVVIVDLKTIQNNHGHKIGEEIIKMISKRLQGIVSVSDLLVKYRDNEFLIISFNNGIVDIEFSDKILETFLEEFIINDNAFILNINIGIASYPVNGESLDAVLLSGDIAVSESRKSGKQVVLFKESLKNAYLERESIEHELKHAIVKDELFMVYQPQVDKEKRIKGVEALIRWNNNVLGFVTPDKFISIAEECGQMPSIGDYVINRAINDINNISSETGIELDLSINVSVKQFQHPEFYNKITTAIEKYSFEPHRLLLEVTESIFIDDLPTVLSIMEKLKSIGLRISLDDFGTGYSSYNLLKNLPIDELKIDKSFVDDVLTNSTSRIMLESLISLAKQMNICTVAEGIEHEEQHLILCEMECDILQGYLFYRPLKVDDLRIELDKSETTN
ncbi:EAL domain-containing protein [Aliivibrio kagoshimensis]|uniref:bifunctional diguanylate cyclase/phosphodiesterase n=1 Tax=Aliivibrio kagoshimensis TaxID=2910230 RepID=UPI003D0CC064